MISSLRLLDARSVVLNEFTLVYEYVLLSKFTKTSPYRKTTFLFLVFQILRILYVH